MYKLIEYIKNNKGRDYTFDDIAVKHYEIWLAVPAFLYILTPVIKFIAFSFEVDVHPLANEDLYFAIVLFVSVISLIPFTIGVLGYCLAQKPVKPFSEIKTNVAVPLLLLTALVAIISTLINNFKTEREWVVQSLIVFSAYFVIYYSGSQLIIKERIKLCLIDMLLAVSIFLGTLDLIDMFIHHIPSLNYTGVTSVFVHANHYGYFLTVPILLSASLFVLSNTRMRKILYFFVFVFNSLMLAFTNTFGSFLGVFVALVFMIIAISIKRQKFSWLSVAVLMLFLVICFLVGLKYPSFFSDLVVLKKDIVNVVEDNEAQNTAGSGRWNLWRRTFELIRERPLLGWGMNGILEDLSKVEYGIGKPHNEYMELAVFYGIPCSLIYIAGLLSVFIKALKNRHIIDNVSAACLIASLAYIGSAFFGNIKFYTFPFFIIMLGLASRYSEKAEKQADTSVT